MPRGKRGAGLLPALIVCGWILANPLSSHAHSEETPFPTGIGDRVTLYRAGQPIDVVDEARRHGRRSRPSIVQTR